MRKLVSGAAYPTNYRGQVIRLAQITTQVIADSSSVTRYFAAEETDWQNNHYRPWLKIDEAIHRYRSLQVDRCTIKLVNSPELEVMLVEERWEGAAVRVLDFFTNIDGEGNVDACELVRGVLGERSADEAWISWPVLPDWDAQSIEAPARNYGVDCSWRFKANECGYPGTDYMTCAKTFADCTLRAQTHRFNGFVQITRALKKIYPPDRSNEPSDRNTRHRYEVY